MSYSGRHPWDANDPYPDDDEEFCDHDDYEADILTGVATCVCCGYRWDQTAEEIERERQAQIAYDKQCEEWERETCPPMPKADIALTDDDLPF